MWLRMRLDIGWLDLMAGFVFCLLPIKRSRAIRRARDAWDSNDRFLITLSVRSAFDLTLRALQLPRGSEVLLSALTVPDMVHIVRAHGLVPVPLDIDENGQVIDASLNHGITSKTRMIVIAHLFGGRAALDPVLKAAHERNILVVEDYAQSFRYVGDSGHPDSDLAMFSFGPIKTATALGGAVVRVKSRKLKTKMAELLAADPIQSTVAFMRRLIRFAALKLLSGKRMASLTRKSIDFMGCDFDALANTVCRGFSPSNLLSQLRKQPSTPLFRLLRRRWQTYDFKRIARRIQMGKRLDAQIGHAHAATHSYWIYPLIAKDPAALHRRLRAAGFDTTSLARMIVVPAVDMSRIPTNARHCWQHSVILPWCPEMPDAAVDSMSAHINSLKHQSLTKFEKQNKEMQSTNPAKSGHYAT